MRGSMARPIVYCSMLILCMLLTEGRLSAWTPANSDVALLGFGRDNDGRIADGRELIGSYTVSGIISNGPNALLALSKEGRALADEARREALHTTINGYSPLFSKLVLWYDANHNGISDAGEVRPAEKELAHRGLGYSRIHYRDRHGNETRHRGYVLLRAAPGLNPAMKPHESRVRARQMYSVCLVSK
jgi:hypothetical protein